MENEECRKKGRRGAQTFRRGRAILFYQQLEVKKETLKQQLANTALTVIHPVIAGELKATEAIMEEFRVIFALDEVMGSEDETRA